jgi:ribosomal protein S12 methylthiotransferase
VHLSALCDELTAQRAEERIGETVMVLVETVGPSDDSDEFLVEGRAACQGPEVDGSTTLTGLSDRARVGDMIEAVVTGTEGVDLVAVPV